MLDVVTTKRRLANNLYRSNPMAPGLERIADSSSEDAELVSFTWSIRGYEHRVTDVYLYRVARILGDFDTRNGANMVWICRNDRRQHSFTNFRRYHPSASTCDRSPIMQDRHGSKPSLIRTQPICSANNIHLARP